MLLKYVKGVRNKIIWTHFFKPSEVLMTLLVRGAMNLAIMYAKSAMMICRTGLNLQAGRVEQKKNGCNETLM